MRRAEYWKRASKRFLNGTRYRSPCEAVEAGARTLEEWARVLEEERDLEHSYLRSRNLTGVTRSKNRFSTASG
jgi:hypothetical protein